MPAARGVKRGASKSSTATASTAPKNKKKRGPIQLEIISAPKKRGRVLTCGQGDVGQLGLGEDVMETAKFKYVTALGDKIVDARAGGMHTIALDSNGKVWTFGCNDEGALGRTTNGEKEEAEPGAVVLPTAAVAISAGDSHSAALLKDGQVYAWGAFRDSHGSMGLVMRGREGKSCKEPVKVDIPEQAVDIASGGDHLVVLTVSGSVYTMGCGEQGQLGRLAQRSATRDARQGFSALLVPSKVTLKLGASRVWAGYHATFVLDATQERMFAWGLNNYGQLGIKGGKRQCAIYSPTECEAFGPGGWKAVSPGMHHSLALDMHGAVHAIGRREYGRLGLGDKAEDADNLEPIPKLANKQCISISAGTSNSFAVTDSGEVYAWGMGSEGQLGTGQSNDASEPVLSASGVMQDRLPICVSAGGQHTVLLLEDPTAQKEPSPAPEKETEEEKVESESEEKVEKPKAKRQKKEQEGEISSTSSAQPAVIVEETKPEKVNGDDKQEAGMEVDETDTKEEKKEEPTEKEGEKMETDSQSDPTETKSEDSDTKTTADVEMDNKCEVNGTPDKEEEKITEVKEVAKTAEVSESDVKSVESIVPAAPLTTTA